jgi:hypothetical protein
MLHNRSAGIPEPATVATRSIPIAARVQESMRHEVELLPVEYGVDDSPRMILPGSRSYLPLVGLGR